MSLTNGSRRNLMLLFVSISMVLPPSLLIAEALVRFREAHRRTVPGTMPFLLYQHARLRTALTRDFDYFGWVHVDREGFRGPEVRVEKAPGVLRIIAVGGSTTLDVQTTADDRTWPSRLGALLREAGHRVEVVNAGTAAYTVLDDFVRLEAELYRYKPDIIILYQAHNDLYAALRGGVVRQKPEGHRPGQVPAISPWMRWLTEHSLLFAKVREGVLLRAFHHARRVDAQRASLSPSEWNNILTRGKEDFTRDLMSYLAVARQLGIHVVMPEVVEVSGRDTIETDSDTRRVWEQSVSGAPVEVVLRGYGAYNAQIRAAASCFGALFVPADSVALKGAAWYGPGDPIHFNDAGADRFAERLASALEASDALLGTASPTAASTRAAPCAVVQ